jgi:hypothetical protein
MQRRGRRLRLAHPSLRKATPPLHIIQRRPLPHIIPRRPLRTPIPAAPEAEVAIAEAAAIGEAAGAAVAEAAGIAEADLLIPRALGTPRASVTFPLRSCSQEKRKTTAVQVSERTS